MTKEYSTDPRAVRQRKLRAAYRADPERDERQREMRKEHDRRTKAKRRSDPEKVEQERARGRRRWQEIKADPVRHAAYTAYHREWMAKRRREGKL